MGKTRTIHSGWDKNDDVPNMFRAYVECEDERTFAVLILPDGTAGELLRKAYLIDDPEEVANSEAYAELFQQHLNECSACKKWAKATNGNITLTFQGVEG